MFTRGYILLPVIHLWDYHQNPVPDRGITQRSYPSVGPWKEKWVETSGLFTCSIVVAASSLTTYNMRACERRHSIWFGVV